MAQFEYTARAKDHKLQRGTITADNQSAATNALIAKELTPILVKPAKSKKGLHSDLKIPFIGNKVKTKDMVVYTRQLATMINAGVPLLKSLATLQAQTKSAKLRQVLTDVTKKVEGGVAFSDALANHPKVFSGVFVNMVRAGETGGILDQILERLAVQLEKEAELKSKVKGAMIYPSIITVITFGAFFFIMTGIIPKLKNIFEQFEGQLPTHTRIMLGISEVLQKHGLIAGIITVVVTIVLIRLIHTSRGKQVFDQLILKIPVISSISTKVNMARFARTFSSLTSAGVPVLDGLNVTTNSISNAQIKSALFKIADKVKNGSQISDAMLEYKIFPALVIQMVAVGEETGEVDEILAKVADFYEKEVDRTMQNLTSIIEPLLIIVLGAMVGLIVASVFGPISKLTEIIK